MSLVATPPPDTKETTASRSFETGVLAFADKLRAFVRARVNNPSDADDVVHDVLLKVFRSRGRLRDPARLEAWIYQTARATIVDHYRSRRPSEELPAGLVESIAPRDEVAQDLRTSVRAFLASLPEHYREPLLLSEFHGLTAARIAERLGLSLTAAKSRLTRGRALLRERMLACCRFETDAYGHVIEMQPRRVDTCACTCDGADMPTTFTVAPARDEDLPHVLDMLRSENLPTADIATRPLIHFIVASRGTERVGCAAVEPLGDIALLRSVAVAPALRRHGVARALLAEIERIAAQLRIHELFLLTTTAEAAFARMGFERILRDDAPLALRETSEFAGVCPASAVVMRKRLRA
jgi:RNA polymerase sigma-70 factor (ECF subfamily)